MKIPKIKQSVEAIVLGLVSGLIAIYLIIKWRTHQEFPVLIYAAVSLGLISTVSHRAANLIAKAWMTLGHLMGKVTGGVLLSIVYFFILTPISKLQKLFSKSIKFKNQPQTKKSTWLERKHQFSRDDLTELW